MDFSTTLNRYHITYLSELPPKDVKVDIGAMVGVPGETQDQIKLYTWYNDEWVFTAIIDNSNLELEELKGAYDDLNNAVKRLIKVSANTESDELFSKISKITSKILQAQYELNDDIIEPFEKH